ncbi:MAG: DUF192 domain-containing protein [Betaproteobacteria bacterium]|nr:DUF192 domain-containing protein [Betaproteobacteria bacterium]
MAKKAALTPFLLFIALQNAAAQLPVATLNAGIHVIRAEVADTFESRARGLMQRESLGPNQGMLFIFPEEAGHCMWMKNTLIPLSVAFLDAKGRIINIADMQPHSEQSHCAARPARYALEMSKGWFSAKGVRPGSVIQGLQPVR